MRAENFPSKIALWGYGTYGKRTAESMKLYWGGAYTVTKIYDINKRCLDRWWNIEVSDPKDIAKDYSEGLFSGVIICIAPSSERGSVENTLKRLDIPFFFTGDETDFVQAEMLEGCTDNAFKCITDDYTVFSLKNMLGAVADHNRTEIMYLFNEEGMIPEESVRHFCFEPEQRLMLPFRLKNAIPERVKLDGEYCVLARLCSANYWHFTFQNADCVSILENAGYEGKYIIKGTKSNLALMHMLGVSDDRIIQCGDLAPHKVYEFEKLLLITYRGNRLDYSVEAVAGIARKINRMLKLHEDAPKKLYVDRVGKRRLFNGREIAIRHGFEVFIPEEHTLLEQMEAFYNADIVLTPHGANSTNCIYMREGAVFAEVFSPKWKLGINQKICEQLGITYLSITGVPVNSISDEWNGVSEDYYVYESQMVELIDKAETLLKTTRCNNGEVLKHKEKYINRNSKLTVSDFRAKAEYYNLNKIVLWGYGQEYRERRELIKKYHDSGEIEVLGITATEPPDLQEIDGWPVIRANDISSTGCDHILICTTRYYCEILSNAVSDLGIDEQMILPVWILD